MGGVLTLKLLDSMVIPFDLNQLADTITNWYAGNLMDAMTTFDCNPNDILGENVIEDMLEVLNDFTETAAIAHEIVVQLANRTASGDVSEEDMDLVDEYNEMLGTISKEFMHAEGLPSRTWHKNILWNTALEDGPSHVFPYITMRCSISVRRRCSEKLL